MPNTREKLIELLRNAKAAMKAEKLSCDIARNMFVVDFMMANGVTVQKWIPLTEQKPDRDDLVIVFFEGMRDTNCAIQIMYGWCLGGSATHWMPLPAPPKGE